MIKASVRGDFSDNIDALIDKLAENIAQLYYDRLVLNIRTNKFGYHLKDKTVKTKMYKGRSALPLIDSGAYLGQIRVEGAKVFVADGIHPESGYDFTELAYVLEYGRKDKSFYGFPVWRDTLKELEPEIQKTIKAFLGKYMIQPDKKVK